MMIMIQVMRMKRILRMMIIIKDNLSETSEHFLQRYQSLVQAWDGQEKCMVLTAQAGA